MQRERNQRSAVAHRVDAVVEGREGQGRKLFADLI
jgi:hypothetical protein